MKVKEAYSETKTIEIKHVIELFSSQNWNNRFLINIFALIRKFVPYMARKTIWIKWNIKVGEEGAYNPSGFFFCQLCNAITDQLK